MQKSNYRTINLKPGLSIKDAVNELLKYKDAPEIVFCEFNGHLLYSDTVSLDSAYKEITGLTYEEFQDKSREEFEKGKE